MPRIEDIPACPPAPEPSTGSLVEQTFEIKLITPMFGGGVTAGEPDESMPIRATAIRGQLRFWWRLVSGITNDRELYRREEEIFGSTEFPSPLVIQVTSQPAQLRRGDPDGGDRFGPMAYALFPAVQNGQRVVLEGIRFTIRLSWPDSSTLEARRRAQNRARIRAKKRPLPEQVTPIDGDIDKALRAWLAFGGIGGRTRRGCGAVHPVDASMLANLPEVPGMRIFIADQTSDAVEAWKTAVKVYRDFRQTPRGPVHQKTIHTRKGTRSIRVPGRSYWPEPDSLRQITGCSLKPPRGTPSQNVPDDINTRDHSRPIVPKDCIPSFPRAVLGLPIVFHFCDGPGRNRRAQPNKDPQDVQVYPARGPNDQELERMASPVITRALWVDGAWHPAVIVLPFEWPAKLGLRLEGQGALPGGGNLESYLQGNTVVGKSLATLRPMRGHANAIDALVDYLQTGSKPTFTVYRP